MGSPSQVYWQALGCTYWVHWHMVEIIGPSGQEEHEGQEKASALTRNHKLAAGEQPVSWACSFSPQPFCSCTLALWILLVPAVRVRCPGVSRHCGNRLGEQ